MFHIQKQLSIKVNINHFKMYIGVSDCVLYVYGVLKISVSYTRSYVGCLSTIVIGWLANYLANLYMLSKIDSKKYF